jgi:hypothetical protein
MYIPWAASCQGKYQPICFLARIIPETPSRDCGDDRATGQPQGLGPEVYLFSTPQGELVLSLPKEHPRTLGFRLCKTGRIRRQGHLRNKAHPEPLPSPREKAGLPDFVSHPATRQGLLLHYQCRDHAPLWSRSPCLAPSDRGRTAISAVAAGGSCIMRAIGSSSRRTQPLVARVLTCGIA